MESDMQALVIKNHVSIVCWNMEEQTIVNRGKKDDMEESSTSYTRSVLLTGSCCMHHRAHSAFLEQRLRDARQ
jgi:hypothetical protein